MSELFYRLTSDVVLQAVADAGFQPTSYCAPLNALENRVFDVRLKDLTHVVAKFYRPEHWPAESLLEEHRFLAELREEEISVCAPLLLEGGTTLGELDGVYYALWSRTGGRATDELLDEDIEILGRLLARVHNVGATRPARHRPTLDVETFAKLPFELLQSRGAIDTAYASRFARAVEAVGRLWVEESAGVPLHRIHGDCHIGNLLNGRDGWYLLDFDDFLNGPAVHDVWLLLPSDSPEAGRQRRIFLDAYRQFRDFEDRWWRLERPLRGLRQIRRAAWIADRWNDPDVQSAFPGFGSEDHWEGLCSTLEALLEDSAEVVDNRESDRLLSASRAGWRR